MLTQEQIEKLEPYINHPRYGKILEKAVEVWKIADPIFGDFGLKLDGKIFKLDKRNGCCLLGASIIETESKTNLICETIIEKYKISRLEFIDLYSGFDQISIFDKDIKSEAYQFGIDVSKIVNPQFEENLII